MIGVLLIAGTFLSTPSARRATLARYLIARAAWLFLSTPSARRATRGQAGRADPAQRISIHALREEGDMLRYMCVFVLYWISIHALREEGDW